MKNALVAAAVLALLPVPRVFAAQQPAQQTQTQLAPAPKKPVSPREAEETQARIYMARKEYAAAAEAYTKLSQKDRRNASYVNYVGLALMQEGDLTGARKQFERATKMNKKFSDAYNNLGAIDYAQKRYPKAVSEYQKAIQIDPHVPGLYSNLGYAYYAEKQYNKATQAFQKAVALDPTIFTQNDRNGTLLTFRSVTDPSMFEFTLAKGFAQNGDGTNCAFYLRRAVVDGYKDIAKVRHDPAFAAVLTDPNMQSLLDQLDPQVPPVEPTSGTQQPKPANPPPGS